MCHFCSQGTLETAHRKRWTACVSTAFLSAIPCPATPPGSSWLMTYMNVWTILMHYVHSHQRHELLEEADRIQMYVSERRCIFRFTATSDSLSFLIKRHGVKSFQRSKVNSSSVSQKIPRLIWNPKAHHRVHKIPRTYPYPEPDESNPQPRVQFLISLILSSHLLLGFISNSLTIGQQQVFRGPILDTSVFLLFK
jgi:hypothetical protein